MDSWVRDLRLRRQVNLKIQMITPKEAKGSLELIRIKMEMIKWRKNSSQSPCPTTTRIRDKKARLKVTRRDLKQVAWMLKMGFKISNRCLELLNLSMLQATKEVQAAAIIKWFLEKDSLKLQRISCKTEWIPLWKISRTIWQTNCYR